MYPPRGVVVLPSGFIEDLTEQLGPNGTRFRVAAQMIERLEKSNELRTASIPQVMHGYGWLLGDIFETMLTSRMVPW